MRVFIIIIFIGLSSVIIAQEPVIENEKKIESLPKSTLKLSILDFINPFQYSASLKSDLPIKLRDPKVQIETELGAIYYSGRLRFKKEKFTGLKTSLTYKYALRNKNSMVEHLGFQVRYKYIREKRYYNVVKQGQFIETMLIPKNINGVGIGIQYGEITFFDEQKKILMEFCLSAGMWLYQSNYAKKEHNFTISGEVIDERIFFWQIPLGQSQRPYLRLSLNFGFANW